MDYLVKLDLTPENLQTALAKAAEKVKKERALLGELSAQENLAESVRSYQERFFVRLYAGLFPDEAALEQPLQHMELNLSLIHIFRDGVGVDLPQPCGKVLFFGIKMCIRDRYSTI